MRNIAVGSAAVIFSDLYPKHFDKMIQFVIFTVDGFYITELAAYAVKFKTVKKCIPFKVLKFHFGFQKYTVVMFQRFIGIFKEADVERPREPFVLCAAHILVAETAEVIAGPVGFLLAASKNIAVDLLKIPYDPVSAVCKTVVLTEIE